jgi:shikimate kinase
MASKEALISRIAARAWQSVRLSFACLISYEKMMSAISNRRFRRGRHSIMINQQIIIVGFMGSGKSTVAHALARLLDRRAIDLDNLISQRENRTPGEIIEQEGEKTFREIETQALREMLLEATDCVIAVGGGGWTIAENRELIAKYGGLAVWLDSSFDLCWKRIEAGREARPLARSRALAEALYATRRPVYELAEARIPVDENESVEAIAQKVARIVLARTANG